MASVPRSPSTSLVPHHLIFFHEESYTKTESHEGSDFGHWFVKGGRPGYQTGFDFDVYDLVELEQFHEIVVASTKFGNYDAIQQPTKISEATSRNIPFYIILVYLIFVAPQGFQLFSEEAMPCQMHHSHSSSNAKHDSYDDLG